MENDPGGREQLMQLGMRHVPVVARGKQFVPAKRMDVIAKFVERILTDQAKASPSSS